MFQRSSPRLIQKYIDLYNTCFHDPIRFSFEYLSWLYEMNPSGVAIGVDAFHRDLIIGQVICVPGTYLLNGKHQKGLLAVNVVVHPKYQGRFLFKKLGLSVCELGSREGYDFVWGVANAAATPGWVRQMGFQLVRPLEAKVGIGSLLDEKIWKITSLETEFRRVWTMEELLWRSCNPIHSISLTTKNSSKIKTFISDTGRTGLVAVAEISMEEDIKGIKSAQPFKVILPRVFLGLIPNFAFPSTYMTIPDKLKPSPLNLVYKNLNDESDYLDPSGCFINFLDFDAF